MPRLQSVPNTSLMDKLVLTSYQEIYLVIRIFKLDSKFDYSTKTNKQQILLFRVVSNILF